MRTTVDIDPELLAEALSASGERSRSRVINKALEELIRRRMIDELIAAAGTFDIEDNTEELEKAELEEMEQQGW